MNLPNKLTMLRIFMIPLFIACFFLPSGWTIGTLNGVAFQWNYVIASVIFFLAYITDTGVILKKNLPLLKDCDYYVFESNHDKTMLLSSSRPIQLKKRILGKKGHLSNEQAGEYLSSLIGPKTKKIYLAHLSEECNTPEIALETIHRVFQKNGISFPIEDVVPLKQHRLIEGGEE